MNTMTFTTIREIAAVRLEAAIATMYGAANAIEDVGGPEAKEHAAELRGAAGIAITWVAALRQARAASEARADR